MAQGSILSFLLGMIQISSRLTNANWAKILQMPKCRQLNSFPSFKGNYFYWCRSFRHFWNFLFASEWLWLHINKGICKGICCVFFVLTIQACWWHQHAFATYRFFPPLIIPVLDSLTLLFEVFKWKKNYTFDCNEKYYHLDQSFL